MSELGLAALLAVTILLASMVSIEIGLSVALIELAAGVAVGNLNRRRGGSGRAPQPSPPREPAADVI